MNRRNVLCLPAVLVLLYSLLVLPVVTASGLPGSLRQVADGPASTNLRTLPPSGFYTTDPSTTQQQAGRVPATKLLPLAPVGLDESESSAVQASSAALVCNTNSIAIRSSGAASPYPSDILVKGQLTPLAAVKVHISALSHIWPDEIDILLVGPQGQNLILLSDAGGSYDLISVDLIFDDAAAVSAPDSTQIVSGSYRPTNYDTSDTFPSPAPVPSTATTLSTFSGTDPNGIWSLYVVDDTSGDAGIIAGGWCLEFVNPSITLEKTVGVDPKTCSATDEIALPPGGGNVTYCYTVENTGNITLNLHDLSDSELGSIFSGLNYALSPGASAFVTQTTTINTNTVNAATWTAYNPSAPSVQASDVATVTVEAIAPSITLEKTVGVDPKTCSATDEIALPPGGGNVTYCYTVENTGNITLNLHDLSDSELGSIFSGLNYALSPGASAFVTQTTTINTNTVNAATWTAYNPSAPSVQASDVATVTVEAIAPSITLEKTVGVDPKTCSATDEIALPPGGGNVTYCYTVENTGNITLNLHDLSDSELGSVFSGLDYALSPGASAFLTQTVTITTDTVNTATWTAYNDAVIRAEATDSATVTVERTIHRVYAPVVMRAW